MVVDVRPTNGGVLFKSGTAAPLTRVDVWNNGYKWVTRTADFDYLQAFIDAGHANGLKVNASINTFVGGCLCPYGLGGDGLLFEDASKKEWASVVNTSNGLVNTMDLLDASTDSGAKFFNPANEDAQNYVIAILKDLAAYDIDGIILDRCRYDDYGLQSDFSDVSRAKFEEYIGHTVDNWPDDVMRAGQTSLTGFVKTLTKQWLEFRVKTIHDFVEKASNEVHAVNPDVRFGAYVGAWYSSYYTSGVNWASPKYDPKAAGYSWASDNYKNYGYADHCDFMFIGAYAGANSIHGSTEWTMEGFCKNGAKYFQDDVIYCGGPDIGNSSGFTEGGQGGKMKDIVEVCMDNSTGGMFFFDLCHVKMFNYWGPIQRAFESYDSKH